MKLRLKRMVNWGRPTTGTVKSERTAYSSWAPLFLNQSFLFPSVVLLPQVDDLLQDDSPGSHASGSMPTSNSFHAHLPAGFQLPELPAIVQASEPPQNSSLLYLHNGWSWSWLLLSSGLTNRLHPLLVFGFSINILIHFLQEKPPIPNTEWFLCPSLDCSWYKKVTG